LLPRKKKQGRPRTRSAPPALNTEKCAKTQKQWTNKNTEAAMKAVIDENTPISRAAKDHYVPVSTLHDKVSGKVSHGDKPGPKPLLSAVEEKEFANFWCKFPRLGTERQERKYGICRESSKG